jgi:hypothetical protein
MDKFIPAKSQEPTTVKSQPTESDWEIKVIQEKLPPHEVRLVVHGTEADARKKIDDIWARGVETTREGLTIFNGPSAIAQIQLKKA